jgi:hypothetical protein
MTILWSHRTLGVKGHGVSIYGYTHNLYMLHQVHKTYFTYLCHGNIIIYIESLTYVKEKIYNTLILDNDDKNKYTTYVFAS